MMWYDTRVKNLIALSDPALKLMLVMKYQALIQNTSLSISYDEFESVIKEHFSAVSKAPLSQWVDDILNVNFDQIVDLYTLQCEKKLSKTTLLDFKELIHD